MELSRTNQRAVERRALPSDTPAVLTVGGQPYDGKLKDYNLNGFGLTVEEGALKRLQRESSQVEVKLGDRTFSGTVRHTRKDGFRNFVGVQTVAGSDAQEITFTNDDPGWDLIEDGETIASLLNDLCFKGPEALIEVRQPSGLVLAVARSVSGTNVLEFEVHETTHGLLTTTTATFRFEIFQTSHAFEAKIEKITDKTFTVAVPKKVARLLRRETFRVRNGTNGVTLTVELSSQLLGMPAGPISLWDINEHGISVVDPAGWAYAPVGIVFDEIALKASDGKQIRGHGAVRGHRWSSEANAFLMGIELETASPADRKAWHNVILKARYPYLDFKYADPDHDKIWGLFERSGYVGHLDQSSADGQLKETRSASRITWELLDASGTLNSRRLMYRTDDDVVGHLQMDRYYTETWCVHHLAIDKVVSKVLAKDLYGAVTDILSTEQAKYLISYHRPDLAWNQRNYYQFVESYPFPNHHHIQQLSLFDVDFSAMPSALAANGTEIRVANKWDLRRIHRYFELNYPPLVREALSVTENDLLLEKLNKEISPFGLERGRQFVIAMQGQELLGFAQVEWGTTGVNVFRLFDAIFLHLLRPGTELVQPLLSLATRALASRGKKRALLFLTKEQVPEEPLPGTHYLCDEVRWIANCVATRRYQAYSQALFGRLLLRRAGRKKS